MLPRLEGHTRAARKGRHYLDCFGVGIKAEAIWQQLPALGLLAEALRALAVVPQPHEGQLAVRPVAELHLQNLVLSRLRKHHAISCWEEGAP